MDLTRSIVRAVVTALVGTTLAGIGLRVFIPMLGDEHSAPAGTFVFGVGLLCALVEFRLCRKRGVETKRDPSASGGVID